MVDVSKVIFLGIDIVGDISIKPFLAEIYMPFYERPNLCARLNILWEKSDQFTLSADVISCHTSNSAD